MGITVNGKPADFVENETIDKLLKRMNFVFQLVVVKIDGVVVPKPEFERTVVPDGSRVEVIHLISGG